MKYIIRNTQLINEGKSQLTDILINQGRIEQISPQISVEGRINEINGEGKITIPGAIDDQVHFREPGLTHKGNIFTESRAAVAGGVTSFMEMPNTVPNTLTQELLEEKYAIASKDSLANYSFFMGASNDNLQEVLKTDSSRVCGIKVFMGSSTGNMLVDNEATLEALFKNSHMLIATHCEDEETIRRNTQVFKEKYGEDVPFHAHPLIRSEEACYKSSSMAVELAKRHGTRLHILHISTAKELALFDNTLPLKDKKITAEACIHHLWFDDSHYKEKGAFIKWNPAVKTAHDREALLAAVIDGRIDVIATDHAPHTWEEKQGKYFSCPSGGPLVQHSVTAMFELYKQGKITLEMMVKKMSHDPAVLFQIQDRGFVREGYFADLAIIDPNSPWTVSKENILAKCGWSPFDGTTFSSRVETTFVSGHLAWHEGKFNEKEKGHRLLFNR